MKIGDVARKVGLDVKTIRYYENIGLVDSPPRSENGYRDYSERGVRQLTFLRHARQFGFSINECRELLALWADPSRRSSELCSLVAEKVQDIDAHIDELIAMKKVLTELLIDCPNDDPDCDIITRWTTKSEL